MSSDRSVNNHAAVAVRPPATVWILTLLMGATALVCVVGAFLFAFPMGGLLGYIVGTLLMVAWNRLRDHRMAPATRRTRSMDRRPRFTHRPHARSEHSGPGVVRGHPQGGLPLHGSGARHRGALAAASHTPLLHEVIVSRKGSYPKPPEAVADYDETLSRNLAPFREEPEAFPCNPTVMKGSVANAPSQSGRTASSGMALG